MTAQEVAAKLSIVTVGTSALACGSCERLAIARPAPRELVARSDHWGVAHAFDANLEGWLVVLPLRHVERLDELTQPEAAELGPLLHETSRALRDVCHCEKTYVILLAEAPGFPHVHFHVVPRAADLEGQYRGARIFGLLGNPELPLVSDDRKDELALALRVRLTTSGVARAPDAP